MSQDITDEKRAEAALARPWAELDAQAALEAADDELRRLANGVSHDVAEPLRSVTVVVRLLNGE